MIRLQIKLGGWLIVTLKSIEINRYIDKEDQQDENSKEVKKHLVDMDLFDHYFFNEEDQQFEDSMEFTIMSVDMDLFDHYFFNEEDQQFEDFSLPIIDQLVNKIYELYVSVEGNNIYAHKYVVLRKTGNYNTVIWDKYNKKIKTPGARPLFPFFLKAHLNGWYTICVFASFFTTKFICFDVDVSGNNKKKKAQKVVRLLFKTLVEYGIPEERIYTSWSGKKGYHVEVFFEDGLSNFKAKEFFEIIVNRPGLNNILNGKIEFRPNNNQAIKLPLGLNYSNRIKKDRLCCFVDIHSGGDFENIDDEEYFLEIQPIDPAIIETAIVKHNGSIGSTGHNLTSRNGSTITSSNLVKCKNDINQEVNSAINQINPEPSSNDMSTYSILKLEEEGLKQPGTRHRSLLRLSILYKNYYNYSREENINKLIEWLNKQDKNMYTTSFEDSIKDIEKIVKYTYDRNYKLQKSNPAEKYVRILDVEMEEVIKVKQKNGKLLLFALLVHNKKHSFLNGIFYMSYNLMSQATGLSERTCIYQMKNLVKQNFVEVVGSKILDDNFCVYRSNEYKLLLDVPLKETTRGHKELTFNYNNKDNVREFYLRGLDILDDNIIRKILTKKDYHLYKKGEYIKL
jgi:hypothetical protein